MSVRPVPKGFQPVGAPALRVMSAAMREAKLRLIAGLTQEELRGWKMARRYDPRPDFDGERAALAARARELGVQL